MTYKIHFVIEADMEVEAKDWNEAEAEFDLQKKDYIMSAYPAKATCEIASITKVVKENAD